MHPRKRIAVIGGGISGIYAAHLLQADYDVDLYESGEQLGGHAYTVTKGVPRPTDQAFVIFNTAQYPLFCQFLRDLGVFDETIRTEMSFAYEDSKTKYWLGRPKLGDLKTLLRAGTLWGSAKIAAQLRGFTAALQAADGGTTFGAFVAGCRTEIGRCFAVPLTEIIWTVPQAQLAAMPLAFLVNYFRRHGLFERSRAGHWRSFPQGSRTYVQAFQRQHRGTVHLNSPVRAVRRAAGKAVVVTQTGEAVTYDAAVLATHADISLRLLAEPTPLERQLLGPVGYHKKDVTLHSDPALLPKARGTWNVKRAEGRLAAASYDMARIHGGIPGGPGLFVSWGQQRPKAAETILTREYEHPTFSAAAYRVQPELPRLNQQGGLYFCGAYFGAGFHEDGCVAARDAVDALTAWVAGDQRSSPHRT